MKSVGLLLVLGACRIGFDELPTDGRDALDAFGSPVHHATLGGIRNDKHPTLTADQLEIYFDSTRACANCFDIYTATRASLTAPWSTPVVVSSLTSPSPSFTPEVSPDGLTLWFASERNNPPGGSDIWVTTRTARSQPWGTPVREVSLSTAGYDSAPSLGVDGLTMTLTSDGAGGQAADIVLSTRATTSSPWSAPMPLAELNTAALDSAGPIRDAGRQIYFDRETTPGQSDIYIATRRATSEPFQDARLLDNINVGDARDIDAWVSADLRTIFFASSRTGDLEIYEAVR